MTAFVYFNIVDDKGDTSTVEIPFPTATALTDLPLLVTAFGALIDPLVSGGLRDAGVRFSVAVPGFSGVAGSLSDVQEKGEFVLRTAGNFLKRLNLPTFIETLILPTSKQIDVSDTDVAAFVTALEDGINLSGAGGSGVVQPCDYRGDDLATLESALENWGKRRG